MRKHLRHPGLTEADTARASAWIDDPGPTALDRTQAQSVVDMVSRLLAGPARDDCPDPIRSGADDCLILAVAAAGDERVDRLVAWGADIHARRESPLLTAIQSGADGTVARCLRLGADARANQDEPIRVAAEVGHQPAVVRALIAAGADPFNKGPETSDWSAVDIADDAQTAAALMLMPENLLPGRLSKHLMYNLRCVGSGDDRQAMLHLVQDRVACDLLTETWRAVPAKQAWAINILSTHITEPWAAPLLARLG